MRSISQFATPLATLRPLEMGQDWRLIDLDQRETFGPWGKLGEFLFDGSPNYLPPYDFADRSELEASQPQQSNSPIQAQSSYDTLRRDRATYFPQRAAQSSILVNLLLEMIQEIYSNVEDILDVVCLITAARFSWAGGRIICAGHYLRNYDMLDHFLSPEKKAEFTLFGDEDGLDDRGRPRYTLYSYPWHERGGSFSIEGVFGYYCTIFKRLGDCLHEVFESLVDMEYEPPEPVQLAILRNLSRHQYVRESAPIRWREAAQAELKETMDVGLGEVVLSRICFSTDGSVAMVYDGDIHRGVWTGDRLDIVAESEFSDDDRSVWMDVSDKVLKEVDAMRRLRYVW
ncbi:hypothetical protein DFH08DRAFT_962891 [Mycena albidolilacea]|uniref:Uncharacterized protein n=1 Tax=Mycena albidolilacea TaxID=1033008 RepID=A0AAD6ZWB9_9AGAR|nr:hypothetical protein DFH08DRAFT_962891 [Mycena albidolilacea]